jgi:starch synthase (maltosyl-transferring)
VIGDDFGRAHRRAAWKHVLSFLTGRPSLLLPFEWVRERIELKSAAYEGIRDIELDRVIGSVNRYRDFDREFLPRRLGSGDRWTRVRQTFDQVTGFPPIRVYQVGEAYFVVDGNHRVSVARQLGMKRIEAEVTHFRPNVPIDEHTDIASLIEKAEYSDFLKRTRLDELRPDQRVEFSHPGGYSVLLEHIDKHRYYLGRDEKRDIGYEEAVASWYDHLYRPLVEIFRQEGLLSAFPKRTEADLYVWVIEHLYYLRQEFGGAVGLETAARDFAEMKRGAGLIGHARNLLKRVGGLDGETEALRRLERRLRRLRHDVEQATYRVPAVWMDPQSAVTEPVVTDAVSFWHGTVSRILQSPRRACVSGPDGTWTRRAVIYNLFVRASAAFDHDGDGELSLLSGSGFRETGTFLKAIALLPYIRALGCNTVHLLPISAIGRDGRKGALGSPYAIRDPYQLEETLAEPLVELGAEVEFAAFVEAAHRLGIRVVVEFVFRTASKDSAWVDEHPDWFYWIRADVPDRSEASGQEGYGSPQFLPDELARIKDEVQRGALEDLPAPPTSYQELFAAAPARDRIERTEDRVVGRSGDGTRVRVPGAFADWPPDDTQPPWGDVTYLRLYRHPDFDYIAYNTIRMYDARLARPENAVGDLWDRIAGILPHFIRRYGIDGAMIDMGHALPDDLKHRIVHDARAVDLDFAFWDEDFALREETKREGYNAAIGNFWWAIHRPQRLREETLAELARRGAALPFFATPETHNTPRCAARPGGIDRSRCAWVFGCFLGGLPFVHSGFECGEVLPVNTGLDFSPRELAAYPTDRLPLYAPWAYAWGAQGDLVATIRRSLELRSQLEGPAIEAAVGSLVIPSVTGDAVAYLRHEGAGSVLVVANLSGDPVSGEITNVPSAAGFLEDRMTGAGRRLEQGVLRYVLEPWEVWVLTGFEDR